MNLDEELVEQLHDDLKLLIDQLADPYSIDRSAIRVIASATCRKWLIDKKISRVGRILGASPKFPAIDTIPHVEAISKDQKFRAYIAGGAGLDGRPINSIYDHAQPPEKLSQPMLKIAQKRDFALTKYLKRKVVFFQGTWLTTEDVVRFTANKGGGVHFDERRDKFLEPVADKARKHLLLGNDAALQPNDHQGPFVFMPGVPDGLWDFTHIEMLAIAQSLVNVKFNDQHLLGLTNSANDRVDDDMLLGIRNHMSFALDADTPRWMIPQNLQNRVLNQSKINLEEFVKKFS